MIMAVSCSVLESDKTYYRRTFIIQKKIKNGTFRFEDSDLREHVITAYIAGGPNVAPWW